MANTLTASDLLDTASRELEDPSNDTWGRFELLNFLNDGLRALAAFRPEEFTTTGVYTLVAGARQTVPLGVLSLFRAIANIDAAGVTRGRAIRNVSMDALDVASPSWRSASPSSTIRECVIPAVTGLEFWVYPPAIGGTNIELQVSKAPEALLNGSAMPCSPDYYPPLIDYVIYRALAKDSEYAAQDGRANQFYQKFIALAAPKQPEASG